MIDSRMLWIWRCINKNGYLITVVLNQNQLIGNIWIFAWWSLVTGHAFRLWVMTIKSLKKRLQFDCMRSYLIQGRHWFVFLSTIHLLISLAIIQTFFVLFIIVEDCGEPMKFHNILWHNQMCFFVVYLLFFTCVSAHEKCKGYKSIA